MKKISVVILAYGDEPWLNQCVNAVLSSTGIELELILVDNGSPAVTNVPDDPRLRVLDPGTNTGFAGGCNFAAEHAVFESLAFVNSDLIVKPDAISFIATRIDEEGTGLVTGAVLLPGEPPTVNSIGNPIHYLMFSWAGAFGEPFSIHDTSERVAGISGAFFGCRREHWSQLRGFDEMYFAYSEDVDLSLRTWQASKAVVFEHRAVGIHHYEFTKSNNKWFLLERNRLINFFTLYTRKSTVILMPIFLVVEIGVLATSIRGGWSREKIASWRWIVNNRDYLRDRIKSVSNAKGVESATWTSVLSSDMQIPDEFGLHVPEFVNIILRAYWRLFKSKIR